MKKKNKLVSNYTYDFEVVGIVCSGKEYRLAWHLNGALGVELKKQHDIKIEFSDKPTIFISAYKHETECTRIELLQNRLVSATNQPVKLLMPELEPFDYLLKFKAFNGESTLGHILKALKDIAMIEYSTTLDVHTLPSKENLLY